MINETTNLLRRCTNPVFSANVLLETLRRVIYAVKRRCMRPPQFYPESVRAAHRKIQRASVVIPRNLSSSIGVHASGDLALCVGKLAFQNEPDWNTQFSDPEVTISLHRWNWLLQALTCWPRQEEGSAVGEISWDHGIELMRSWLRHHTGPRNGAAWEPYTAGERISNAYLFARFKGCAESLPTDLRSAMDETAYFLSNHLEYRGPDATGNHVVNNARALFFASRLLDEVKYADLSIAILREALPKLVNNGFLREGSSHYHFLFARWLLEAHWLAEEARHLEMSSLVEPVAKELVKRCWFFLVRNNATGQYSIPLIGDVSPDCSPQWLLSLPWSDLALRLYAPEVLPPEPPTKGWAGLWPSKSSTSAATAPPNQSDDSVYAASAEWQRVDWKSATLFAHCEPHGGRPYASHRHGDLTAFVLYWDGWPLFADPGRLSYQPGDLNPLSNYGTMANAHNSIVIDRFEPAVPVQSSRLPGFYCRVQVQRELNNDGEVSCLTIKHDGFSRLVGDSITHTRRLCLGESGFSIEDELSGCHPHEIETYFHFAPDVGVVIEDRQAGTVLLTWAEGRFKGIFRVDGIDEIEGAAPSMQLKIGDTGSKPAGWFFPAYGELEPCATVVYRESVRLPWRRRYSLRLEK